MRYLVSFMATILLSSYACAGTPDPAEDTGLIQACAKIENGQLRVVDDPSECNPSERPISWGGDTEPSPVPIIKPCCNKPYQFVGFSEKAADGGSGILKFNLMCQETFPESRTCSTNEVVTTTKLPSIVGDNVLTPAPYGWVRPASIGGNFDTIVGMRKNPDGLACNGWMQTASGPLGANTGLSVNRYGQFTLSVCVGMQLKVACCAVVDDENEEIDPTRE